MECPAHYISILSDLLLQLRSHKKKNTTAALSVRYSGRTCPCSLVCRLPFIRLHKFENHFRVNFPRIVRWPGHKLRFRQVSKGFKSTPLVSTALTSSIMAPRIAMEDLLSSPCLSAKCHSSLSVKSLMSCPGQVDPTTPSTICPSCCSTAPPLAWQVLIHICFQIHQISWFAKHVHVILIDSPVISRLRLVFSLNGIKVK